MLKRLKTRICYQVPPTPKEMGKEKEGRVEKEKSEKKKDKQKAPPPDDEVGCDWSS